MQWAFEQNTGLLPDAAATLSPLRRVVTPMLGAACAMALLWAVQRWSQASKSEEYISAVRLHGGRIKFPATFWRTVSSGFSVATGAAIGREGSMIQFAASLGSWAAARSPIRSLPISEQVVYAAAAAVAAVYQAPLAGIFFALEIVIGEWVWTWLPQLALAATAGWFVSKTCLGGGPLFPVLPSVHASPEMLWALPFAVLLALLGPLYQLLLESARGLTRWPLPLLWGGLVVGAFSLWYPEVWGNGDKALNELLSGHPGLPVIAALLMLRLIATTVCVGAGTVGGVFTPTLFAGAAMGLAAAHMLHLAQPEILAIVGLGALMAAVTHAPIMASFMAVELTGAWNVLPLLLIANVIAFLIARKLSPASLYAIATSKPTR